MKNDLSQSKDKQKTGRVFCVIIFIDCEITWHNFFYISIHS